MEHEICPFCGKPLDVIIEDGVVMSSGCTNVDCPGNSHTIADDRRSQHDDQSAEAEKVAVTLPGIVEKIIPAIGSAPEKAQITVEGAEPLYREIRVENTLQDPAGNPVSLKKGAEVEITIEAEPKATAPKKQDASSPGS